MNQSFPELAELRALLDALCEETITPEQFRRLEELILTRPEAEAYYVEHMRLHADLEAHFAGPPGRGPERLRGRIGEEKLNPAAAHATVPLATAPRRRRRALAGFLALGGVAAALFLALGPWRSAPRPVTDPEDAPGRGDSSVAVLLQASGASWEDTGMPTRTGAPLPPGRLHLNAGTAQIEFYSGAIVVLQGPADLQLISPTEAYCARGRLRVMVPPSAAGFTVGSPRASLVDRGTEFGLQVGADDRTEVHVFQGKVDLYDPDTDPEGEPRRELLTGQGVRLDGPDKVSAIGVNQRAFLTTQDLARQLELETRRRQDEWRQSSDALRRDPSLVLYYPFDAEPAWSRTVHDATGGGRPAHDGAIVGCTWVPGRWPGRVGLQFKRLGDRVRLHVPGEFRSLTLAAWVRVDSLPNPNNALFLCDGWKEGVVHWQIGHTGTLILGVRNKGKDPNAHYHAEDFLTPEYFGQWIQLAVVYDADAGVVTHYVDGRAAARIPVKFDIPLRIGDAQIGNWNVPARRDNSHVRTLNGCMDEFMVFSRALQPGEIEALYEQGRPPQ